MGILYLGKLTVELAQRQEILRRFQTDDPVAERPDRVEPLRCAHWHCHHDLPSPACGNRWERKSLRRDRFEEVEPHGSAGGQPGG